MTESSLLNLRKRPLLNIRIHDPTTMFLYFLLLALPTIQATHPLICNRNTGHQCVCEAGPRNSSHPISCEDLIQGDEIPVVDIRARHVNLEARLHTTESYESYFKKRIAQIVSSYCENEVNECPGVSLKMTKNDARMSDENFVLYATDENDPLFTQDNIILLKVEKEFANVTRILFAIIKNSNIDKITEDNIVDSNTVKVILGSNAVPLSRILGGIRLNSVGVSRLRKDPSARADAGDNTKLVYMIAVIGTFFLICYIIGGIKLYRAHRDKRSKRKREMEALAAKSATPNYGTLTSQKSARNGSLKQARQELEAVFESEYRSIDETIPEMDSNEPRHLTERQARFMFMCDASQLPREPTFDSTHELDKASLRAGEQKEKTPSAAHEVIREEEEVQQQHAGEGFKEMAAIPQLMIVSSTSMNHESPAASPAFERDGDEGVGHLRSESPPIERPTSRRGSRVDEEEIDLTEIGANRPLFTDLVVPDDIEPHLDRPNSVEKWSSSEGEVDVYYKMSDDEELKGDDWTQDEKGENDEAEESDADNEEEETEKPKEGGFVYERLREDLSPHPPVNES